MARHLTAAKAFHAERRQVDRLLRELDDFIDSAFDADAAADLINWGHVGNLSRVRKLLQQALNEDAEFDHARHVEITSTNSDGSHSETISTTLADWFAEDDGLNASRRNAIRIAWELGREYRGGGGAATVFAVKRT